MDSKKITELINKYYTKSERQILFWYDDGGEFSSMIDELDLNNIKIHKLTGSNYFATKKLLEHDDIKSNYLIYAPYEKPEFKDNWLADTLFYSQEFTPDPVSDACNELGIYDISLRQLVKTHIAFFKNQDRLKQLKKLISEYTEHNMEMAMMSVLCKEKISDFNKVTQRIIIESLINEKNLLAELKKFSLDTKFWNYAKSFYGYSKEQEPKKLLASIILTALKAEIGENYYPDTLKKYLCDSSKSHACTMFIHSWMNDNQTSADYKTLSKQIENDYNIRKNIKDWTKIVYNFADTEFLEGFDREIILHVVDRLKANDKGFTILKGIISKRIEKYFYADFKYIYDALYQALELYEFMQKYSGGFPVASASDIIKAYANDYYKADMAYRKFYFAYEKADNKILDEIKENIENLYTNKFLENLTSIWSSEIEKLAPNWNIKGVENQKDFFLNNIEKSKNKSFVIISDALRYEVAAEILSNLNIQLKGDGSLNYMLSSIPSYTKLGMAALLPHKEIKINTDGCVLVDGMSSASSEGREKILQNYIPESKVLTYNDFKTLGREGLRTELKDCKVVYLYHNKIDAIGDDAKTEKDVFKAVQETINELFETVKFVINNSIASNIYITSDHGFLYKYSKLEEHEKITVGKVNSIELKKRFILSDKKLNTVGVMDFNMDYILKNDNLYASIPLNIHRFKTQGAGINFVHGGASLQELVIPVLSFKYNKKQEFKKVDVILNNTSTKITNNTFTLNLFQTESISDKIQPRKLKISLWDIENNIQISNELFLIANSMSDNIKDREFKIPLSIDSKGADSNKTYYLKLEDDGEPYAQIPFTINIAFTNDFDF